MSTLVSREAKFQRAYVPTSALAKSVRFDEDIMHVSLTDGRVITYRSFGFPCCATPRRNKGKYEIGGGGTSLHWPESDEDLSICWPSSWC